MKRAWVYIATIVLMALVTAGCSSAGDTAVQPIAAQQPQATQQPEATGEPEATQQAEQQPEETAQSAGVVTLTAADAKARLDSEEGIIIVDVRTQQEYDAQRIPGAILLPVDSIPADAQTVIPDKDGVYFLYCRSGNRSATAAAMLDQMGYRNIVDFGGIIDWPYETVSE